MNIFYRPALMFLMIVAVSIFAEGQSDGYNESEWYFCPPCGCPADSAILNASGRCPNCRMPLLKGVPGLKQNIRKSISPIFQHAHNYSRVYVRIIYPLILFEVLLTILILFTSKFKVRTILFSVFILSISLYMFKFQLYGTVYALNISKRALFFPISFIALMWPSFYFMVKLSSKKNSVTMRELVIHAAPGIVLWFIQLILFIRYPRSESMLFNGFDSWINPLEQMVVFAGGIYYGWRIYRLVQTNGQIDRVWLLSGLVFPVLFTAIIVVLVIVNGAFYQFLVSTLDYHLLWFAMALSIPWFCYLLWRRKEDLFRKMQTSALRVPLEKIDTCKQKIVFLMEQVKPYHDPRFSLEDMAKLSGLTAKATTEILKTGFQSGFYDFVNLYRVNEVKRLLLDPDNVYLTIFALGEKVGFRSKATFINYFKKYEGMTPKEYKVRNS